MPYKKDFKNFLPAFCDLLARTNCQWVNPVICQQEAAGIVESHCRGKAKTKTQRLWRNLRMRTQITHHKSCDFVGDCSLGWAPSACFFHTFCLVGVAPTVTVADCRLLPHRSHVPAFFSPQICKKR